jgi:hypothetical protein
MALRRIWYLLCLAIWVASAAGVWLISMRSGEQANVAQSIVPDEVPNPAEDNSRPDGNYAAGHTDSPRLTAGPFDRA